jgi:hypothetical protein
VLRSDRAILIQVRRPAADEEQVQRVFDTIAFTG